MMVAGLEVVPLVEKGQYRRLGLIRRNGVWMCQGRMGPTDLQKLTGADALQVLPRNSDLARLRMYDVHQENHDAVDGALAKSRL